jgi:ribosome-associated toxin RatA of RatAB toxin-antitoxin module
MRSIQTTNSKILPHTAMQIWKVITDLSSYSAWWPSSIKIKTLRLSKELIGSRIEVRPYGGQAFCCEVSNINDSKELTLKYSGIYSGTGMWTISEINGQSLVTYKIELKIQNTMIRLLSFVLPVASIHSKLMEEVLTGLGHYLEKLKSAPNPSFHRIADKFLSR